MALVKLLKRGDLISVIFAVIVAGALVAALNQAAHAPSVLLTGIEAQEVTHPDGPGWRYFYLQPVVGLLLQLVILEVLAWLALRLSGSLDKKSKKRKKP